MCVHTCLYACACEHKVTVKKKGLMNLKEQREVSERVGREGRKREKHCN